ncbi:MAG: MBL fold metallo-hydrolase [Phycisphaerales bacterium]|nr:MAG: MBL fold metallo-hydrolase [Phycisphaerales bacterium]
MLTLTFLGTGSAFAKRNFNSNALVEAWRDGPDRQSAPDATLLIDFGVTGPLALHALMGVAGFEYLRCGASADYRRIERVFVTHTHFDHVGGLEELAFCNLHVQRDDGGEPRRPMLLSGAPVIERLWEQSLRGGLGVLHGRAACLEDYFEAAAIDVGDGRGFRLLDRYRLDLFATDHIRLAEPYDWPSYGLCVRDESSGRSSFYSGDTRHDPAAFGPMLAAADVSFHEVQLGDEEDPVHARLDQLRLWPPEVRRRIWLYHYSDDWDAPRFASVAGEFAGFARPGRRYVLFD